jgi:hypothetical protein
VQKYIKDMNFEQVGCFDFSQSVNNRPSNDLQMAVFPTRGSESTP